MQFYNLITIFIRHTYICADVEIVNTEQTDTTVVPPHTMCLPVIYGSLIKVRSELLCILYTVIRVVVSAHHYVLTSSINDGNIGWWASYNITTVWWCWIRFNDH